MLCGAEANGKLKLLWLDLVLGLNTLKWAGVCGRTQSVTDCVLVCAQRAALHSSGPLPLEPHQVPWSLVSHSANKTFCTAALFTALFHLPLPQRLNTNDSVRLCKTTAAGCTKEFKCRFKSGNQAFFNSQYGSDFIIFWQLLNINKSKYTRAPKKTNCYDLCTQEATASL